MIDLKRYMVKIALIGDVMLDVYRYFKPRFNPECDGILCGTHAYSEYMPGGAGNVAANLVALGSDFLFVSLVGSDHNGYILRRELERKSIPYRFVLDESRPTIVKERFMMLPDKTEKFRFDDELTHPASEEKTSLIYD